MHAARDSYPNRSRSLRRKALVIPLSCSRLALALSLSRRLIGLMRLIEFDRGAGAAPVVSSGRANDRFPPFIAVNALSLDVCFGEAAMVDWTAQMGAERPLRERPSMSAVRPKADLQPCVNFAGRSFERLDVAAAASAFVCYARLGSELGKPLAPFPIRPRKPTLQLGNPLRCIPFDAMVSLKPARWQILDRLPARQGPQTFPLDSFRVIDRKTYWQRPGKSRLMLPTNGIGPTLHEVGDRGRGPECVT